MNQPAPEPDDDFEIKEMPDRDLLRDFLRSFLGPRIVIFDHQKGRFERVPPGPPAGADYE